MYALTKINNHYSMFAGQRGDFVVVGHPEYKLGRYGSEQGLGKGWDTTKFATGVNPNASATMKKLQASRRVGSPRLRGLEPKKPPLKARALERSKSASDVSAAGGDTMDNFIKTLTAPGSLPDVHKNPHNLQYMLHSTRHFVEKRDQLADLKEALLQSRDIGRVRKELEQGNAWRYHAKAMQEVRSRASKREMVPDNLHPSKQTFPVGHGRWNYNHPPPVPGTAFSTIPSKQERA